jgi:glucokinase
VRDARVLQASRAAAQVTAGGTVAVIGAGTGLGHCALVPDGRGGHLAVPSEAGHMAFPFVGDAEHAYGEHVRRAANLAYCHGDAVVSGSGLSRLHAFLTGDELAPAVLAPRLASFPHTVEWFARFYGRAARNYALAVLALGGVYICGGVAAKSPLLVEHPAFLEEFGLSPAHHALLSRLPVLHNSNEDSGVFGAALFGAQRLRRRT